MITIDIQELGEGEDGVEARANLAGFFRLLDAWDRDVRDGAVVAHLAHTQDVGGSNPPPASNPRREGRHLPSA